MLRDDINQYSGDYKRRSTLSRREADEFEEKVLKRKPLEKEMNKKWNRF